MNETRPLNILVIEDDEDYSELICRHLSNLSEQTRIERAYALHDAQMLMHEMAPDLIVCDWQLPDGTGLDLLNGAGGLPPAPVVVMTGRGDEKTAVEAMRAGAMDYVTKHLEAVENLPHVCHRAMRQWHAEQDRMQAEQALRESQRNLKSLFDNLEDFCFILELDGKVIHYNPVVGHRLGYSDEQLLEMNLLELLATEQSVSDRAGYLSSLLQDQRGVCHVPIMAADGTLIQSETRITRGHWDDRSVLFAVARDVSERQLMEEQLRRERDTLSRVMQTSPAAIMIVNIDGEIVFANERAEAILGVAINQILSRHYDDALWQMADFDGVPITDEQMPFRRVLSTGQAVFDMPISTLRPDGQRRLLLINGAPIMNEHGGVGAVVYSMVDVTDQMRVEDALRRERNLFLRGPVVVFKWANLPGRPIEYVSPNVVQFGYAASELERERRTFDSLIHPDDRSMVNQEVQVFADAGAEYFEQDYRLVRTDGEQRWVTSITVVLRNDRSEVTHYDGYLIDITERKYKEEQLRVSEERLHLAMEATRIGIWDWDVRADQLYLSGTVALLIDCQASELPQTFADFRHWVHPDDRGTLTEAVDEHLFGIEDNIDVEVRVGKPDGRWRWCLVRGEAVQRDKQGRGVRLTGLMANVTERHVALEALQESEQRHRILFANNPIPVLVVDPTIGQVVDANAAAAKFYGYSWDQFHGMPVTRFNVTPEVQMSQVMEDALTGKQNLFHFTHRLSNGALRQVEVYTGPISIGGKQLLYSIIHDITDRQSAIAETLPEFD